MAKKVGTLIKEARTEAGLTQEQLAKKVKGLTASDISKVERGLKDLTNEQLKLIAKATGVTQKSLLEAAKGTSSSSSSSSSKGSKTMKVTASEKKLVELYRNADTATRKSAVNILKGTSTAAQGLLTSLLGDAASSLLKDGTSSLSRGAIPETEKVTDNEDDFDYDDVLNEAESEEGE